MGDDDSDEEGGVKERICPYTTYLYEANFYFRRCDYATALRLYDKAVELGPADLNCRVARAKCYLNLANTAAAMDDIEKVLKVQPNNSQAMCLKADTLYLKGVFEVALVLYLRGHKLRPDLNCFQLGIRKCQHAIRSSIGGRTRIRLENLHIRKLRDSQNDETKQRVVRPTKGKEVKYVPVVIDVVPTPSMLGVIKPKIQDRIERQLMDDLMVDVEFCRQLLKRKRALKLGCDAGADLKEKIQSILLYLDIQCKFLDQKKPINPFISKRDVIARIHLRMRPMGGIYANMLARVVAVDEKLQCLENNVAEGQWEDVLHLSKQILRLLLPVKYTLWDEKAHFQCQVYCAMGQACLELGRPEKALSCHERQLQIASRFNLQEDKDTAYEYLGKTYVALKMYDMAIKMWRTWLPRCTQPVLRSWLYHELGICYLELDMIETALDCAKNAYQAAVQGEDDTWHINSLVLLARCEVKLGNFRSAATRMETVVTLAQKVYASDAVANLNRVKEEIQKLVKEVNFSSEDIEIPIFTIADDEIQNLFPQTVLKALDKRVEKTTQQQPEPKKAPKVTFIVKPDES